MFKSRMNLRKDPQRILNNSEKILNTPQKAQRILKGALMES